MDIRKFFTMKVVKHWKRLPRKLVGAPRKISFSSSIYEDSVIARA